MADEAFYGVTGDIVKTLEPMTEASPASLLIQMLIGLGNIVGRSAVYKVGGDKHSPNLFGLIVGSTATARKGTSWRIIKEVLAAVDTQWVADHIKDGLSSGEGLIAHVNLVPPSVLSDRRLLLVEGEFASTLNNMRRDGNNLSPVLRNAWDTDSLSTLTKHNAVSATNAYVSLIGHITEYELHEKLKAVETSNGFGNRFLYCYSTRSKSLPHAPQFDPSIVDHEVQYLRGVIAGANQQLMYEIDPAAKQYWADIYESFDSNTDTGLVGNLTARGAAQTIRLATLFAALDSSNSFIRREHLEAAVAVVRYSQDTVRYLFGNKVNNSNNLSEVIYSKLLASQSYSLTKTEVHGLFHRNKTKGEIDKALDWLIENEVIESETVGGKEVFKLADKNQRNQTNLTQGKSL